MSETNKIPLDRLQTYFDAFTKRFLRGESTDVADVEVISSQFGDRSLTKNAHLVGVTYDPRSNALEFAFDTGDHRIYSPTEVWTAEESNGFVNEIDIVRPDGTREVVTVKRQGLQSTE